MIPGKEQIIYRRLSPFLDISYVKVQFYYVVVKKQLFEALACGCVRYNDGLPLIKFLALHAKLSYIT
jgi:hypothetical protein